MKKVLVIDSGLKPGWTKKTADMVIEYLGRSGNYEIDRINLRDEQIMPCQGCAICLDRGEEKCRNYKDSADKIINRMLLADGIITVSPNYSLQVPANLKTLYDRLAYVFHRPRLFGKTSMAIVVQGVYGGKKVTKYIDELMSFWGCSTVKGAVISGALYPNSKVSQAVQNKTRDKLTAAVQRMTRAIDNYKPRHPSFFRLAIFRMTRSSMKYSPEALSADKKYYTENGWMESKYYYPVKLEPVHAVFGAMIDGMIKNMIRKAS